MQIAILCGGLATRLGNISKNTPKSMINIEGKPFLEYQINELKKQNVKDFVLCVGHLSEQIKDYFGDGKSFDVEIKYSHDGDIPLGPIGALKKAQPLLDDVFFTLYGDSFVFADCAKIYNFFTKQNTLGLMTVFHNHDQHDKSNVIIKDGKVVQYSGKKTQDMKYVDYGLSIFKKETLNIIPENTFFSTKDLFTKLVEQNQLLGFEMSKRFYHIGNLESLEEFRNYIKNRKQNL